MRKSHEQVLREMAKPQVKVRPKVKALVLFTFDFPKGCDDCKFVNEQLGHCELGAGFVGHRDDRPECCPLKPNEVINAR